MSRMTVERLITMSALAGAITVGACANDNRTGQRDNGAGTVADTADQRGHEGAMMSLTGCLQRGDGTNDYILTQVNQPSESVGTSGTAAGAAERQQMRAARHAYRLSGDNDDFKNLVGKQVRVSGRLEDGSDVWRKSREAQAPAGDTESRTGDANQKRPEIDERDLGKLEVNTIEQMADACGPSAGAAR